jgi:hypothetical protein
MSSNTAKNSGSYDDIVRRTVVDPDSSARPSREQEREAREGFRATSADEQALHDRVQRAIAGVGGDGSQVICEVSDERVTLRGQVTDSRLLRAFEDAVAAVPGVEIIHNQIVVAPA